MLSLLLGSITVPCATVNPAPYYQRSNDGSYRYGYNAGDGFNARQSANAANEVVGQYTQLQPDGRIDNVRYKAGVGGFRPQYGAGRLNSAQGIIVITYYFSIDFKKNSSHMCSEILEANQSTVRQCIISFQ